MKVVMVEPGQYARIEELDTGLESLQKAVGGLIDCAYPWKDMACVVCNDEGLINGMPLNREVPDYGPIAGPFFVCGIEGENFCSLTDEQADKYKKMFLQPELFVPYKDGLIRLAYDNPALEGAPEGLKKTYELRHNLPELCFCALPKLNMVMLTKRGQSGYWPIEHIPEGMGAGEYADSLNQILGVSKAQQAAMMCGSMISWAIPAARPDRYDENGKLKPRDQQRGNKER